jgi:hypothetical protein
MPALLFRWRWRESNPRPRNSITDVYKLSRLFCFSSRETRPTALHLESADRSRSSFLSVLIGVRTPHTDFYDVHPRLVSEGPGWT